MTATFVVAVAIYVWSSGGITRQTNQLGEAVLHKSWAKAYAFMSPAEVAELNMDRDQFSRFCDAFSSYGWPDRDHLQIEEIEPYLPGDAQADSSWSKSGSRRYSVTFRRPTGESDLVTKIEFRHDVEGEWHPDVMPFIFSIGRGVPHGKPVLGLIAALHAIGRDRFQMYPLHERTSIAELNDVLKHKGRAYLLSPIQHLH